MAIWLAILIGSAIIGECILETKEQPKQEESTPVDHQEVRKRPHQRSK